MFDNFLGWKVRREKNKTKNKRTRQRNKRGDGNQIIDLRFQTGE